MRAFRLALAATLVAGALVGGSGPTAGAGPSAGGFASDNVRYLSTVPFDAGTAWGARFVGKHLFVASYRNFSIYDVSDPLAPRLLSTVPTPTLLTGEDVDTNGEILLLTAQTPVTNFLLVYDVEDKTSPTLISTLEGAGDHTISCLLDCKWAYGSNTKGVVVDLRNPAKPRLAGSWRDELGLKFVHDVTEVAPGRVVTASMPMMYLDARKDPSDPKILAMGWTDQSLTAPTTQLLPGSSRWAHNATDDFLLFGYESPFHGTCNETSGGFTTWDATKWRKKRSFEQIDEFKVTNGSYADGSPPAGVVGCGALWFDDHPKFRNGGLVAAAWAEHGTRILEVSKTGRISEKGYFVPFAGETAAAYWITSDIVYAIDLTRGIDILRLAG